MDLIQDFKEESLDIEDDDVYPSEVGYPQNSLQDEGITDDVPSQVSIKEERSREDDDIDIQSNYQGGIADPQVMGGPIQLKEELGIYPSENQVMQKRELNHFVDKWNLQTSNEMRYVNCSGHEKEEVTFQCVDEYGDQQEKGNVRLTSEKRGSDCEDLEMIASKEEESDQYSVGENEAASRLEDTGSKDGEEENEEGLRQLRGIRVVKWATEETCLTSESRDCITCHHCGHRRETKEEMSAHIRTVHGFGCGESKDRKGDLTINDGLEKSKGKPRKRSTVSGVRKRHICSTCHKRFRLNIHLQRHTRIHTGEKPFKCAICDYRSSQNEHLKMHTRIHTGEKPYGCSECDFRCSQNGRLKVHMRIHTGERPYRCTVCGSGFRQSGDLKIHSRVHTGEKPYVCTICGYRCSRNVYLKIHLLNHGGEKPFKCPHCEYRCSEKGNLKKHIKTHNR